MTLNGKRAGFTMEDFGAVAKTANMKRGRAEAIVKEVSSVVRRWPEFAAKAKLNDGLRDTIQRAHCLVFPAA
jgi:serine/threonine-protein kinase HipA